MYSIAKILTPISLDREFDYDIPSDMRGKIRVGSSVRIPFGRRTIRGFVTGFADTSTFSPLKPIAELLPSPPLFDDKMVELARWMADYYVAPFEKAIAAVLPAAVRKENARHKLQWVAAIVPEHMAPEVALQTMRKKSPKAVAAWEYLQAHGEASAQELNHQTGVSLTVLRTLAKKGWILLEQREALRNPAMQTILPTEPLALMPQQAAAVQHISAHIDQADARVTLLYGVTGSGKTEVYLQSIQYALSQGKGAIVLVPEISLTPQTMERFRGRFGDCIAVLHSGLSDGERHDEWHRIARGEASVVVGARSALFAPVKNPGLIIVDEEHEPAYKQDEAPRYNARDVAVMRGAMYNCAVVLGSATPSLETFQNVKAGKYDMVQLPHRVDHQIMPIVRVVDMRVEMEKTGGMHILSQDLLDAIYLRLDRAEQVILFLNRRGFATSIVCPVCGYVARCENCSINMTYHKHDDCLACHICGDRRPAPALCENTECKHPTYKMTGVGTQRVESAIAKIFTKARIARMDADSTSTKNSHQRILDDFRHGKIDILIGTQMIAKGLDFPRVTLVGVIHADLSLQMPDFRGAERTFQLLTQVAGRAGRGEIPGEVFIQTYTPFNTAIQTARNLDFDAFFDQEIEMRRLLNYPPFTRMTTLLFRGKDETLVKATAEKFCTNLQKKLPATVKICGPAWAALQKAKGEFRMQITLYAKAAKSYIPILRRELKNTPLPRNIHLNINVDALSTC